MEKKNQELLRLLPLKRALSQEFTTGDSPHASGVVGLVVWIIMISYENNFLLCLGFFFVHYSSSMIRTKVKTCLISLTNLLIAILRFREGIMAFEHNEQFDIAFSFFDTITQTEKRRCLWSPCASLRSQYKIIMINVYDEFFIGLI